MESIALGCAAARSDGGGGSDKHSAAGDRTPMANGDSDGSQVRTADGYKIPSAAAPAAAVALDVWWLVIFPYFQIPIPCSREFILFLCFLD